jgi:hypothetical protein
VVEAARLAAAGDFSVFQHETSLFQMFPYQLGIVAFYEPFFRLLGDGAYTALWLVNAAALAERRARVVVLCEELFPDRRRRVVCGGPARALSAADSVYFVSLWQSPRFRGYALGLR